MKPPTSVRTAGRSRVREQPLRSRYNRPTTKGPHVGGALKDHLVDPKVLPVDQAGRPQGLVDLLVDPEVHPAKKKYRLENHELPFLEGEKQEV